MAWFNPPTLQARYVEGLGATPAYAIDGAAMPRRIWELREQSLAALRAALALLGLLPLLLARTMRACSSGAPGRR